MKTTWVLTEEERKQKFEGRKKKRKSGSFDEEMVDCPMEVTGRLGINDRELQVGGSLNKQTAAQQQTFSEFLLRVSMAVQEVEQYVKLSGHWDLSKVKDMNTNLIREFIRCDTGQTLLSS